MALSYTRDFVNVHPEIYKVSGKKDMRITAICIIGLFHVLCAQADTSEKLNHYLSLSLEELMDLKVTIYSSKLNER